MTVELAHPSTEPKGSRSPAEPAHPRWWFISTTPGRILTIGVVLAALGVSSAFATSTTINHRQQVLTTVLNHTEPLSFAAGRLYTTLSVADAAAATAFIAQAEPRPVRQRYEQAITDASVAVTRASSGLTDEPLVQLLGRINAELAVYTGLIEIARTNNREGNPVGSSYLSEASGLMQSTLLPDAAQLYQATTERVDTETTASTHFPAPVILVVGGTLVFGAFSHRWLARRTRRRINPGLVVGALGSGEDDSTPAFDKLEDQLGKAMDQSRTHLRNDVLNARGGLSGAQVGGVVLSLGAATAVALGLWPRLKEYR